MLVAFYLIRIIKRCTLTLLARVLIGMAESSPASGKVMKQRLSGTTVFAGDDEIPLTGVAV
jgi:hypothetical protein